MYAAACMPLRLSITAYVRVSNGGVARSHGVLFYLMCTHSLAQTSPQGMGHAVSLSFHRFKGRPYKRWMSFKKKMSLLMDMNLALPFITSILFRLDHYRAVTWVTRACMSVHVCEDVAGKERGEGKRSVEKKDGGKCENKKNNVIRYTSILSNKPCSFRPLMAYWQSV